MGGGGGCINKEVEMPIRVNAGGRAEVMLTQTLEGVVVVALRANFEILNDWEMRLSSSPPVVA